MKRIVLGGVALTALAAPLFAQDRVHDRATDEIKGKIFDAKMAQQSFANGLKFCGELDGSSFYFEPRHRVLNLEDYHRSLLNLAQQHAFNPEKRKPWTEQDAAFRWDQVKQEAAKEKNDCALVASLPELEKKLEEMEKKH
jgi:hypothetical protein